MSEKRISSFNTAIIMKKIATVKFNMKKKRKRKNRSIHYITLKNCTFMKPNILRPRKWTA